LHPNIIVIYVYISVKGVTMRDIQVLLEYQKFNPNVRLQAKIDMVTEKYLTDGEELADDDLDVAAAGESQQSDFLWKNRM